MPAEPALNTSVQHHKTDRNILDYRADIKPFGGNEVLGMTGPLIPPASLSFLARLLKAGVCCTCSLIILLIYYLFRVWT